MTGRHRAEDGVASADRGAASGDVPVRSARSRLGRGVSSIAELDAEDLAEVIVAETAVAGDAPAAEALVERVVEGAGPDGPSAGATDRSLRGQAARGALVTLAGQGTRIVLQMASVIVLARLLTPNDYGLIGIVLVIVGIGEVVRDFGLSTAAVRAPHLSRQQRDNLFWLNTALGLALTAIVLALAPVVADLLHRPELQGITEALAFTFTINGLAAQYRADLNRRMTFARLAAADVVGQATALVVAILAAVLGAGYWALVAQQLAQYGTALILVVIFAGWRARRFRRGSGLRPLLVIGRNLAITQLINYLSNNLDNLTITVRFTPHALGLYSRSFQLLMTPLNQLRSPATTVALPVLVRLGDDYDRAGEYLRRAQLAFGYTIVAALAIAAGAATPIVAILLGPQWVQIPPIFALLAIAASFQLLAYVGFWVYLSRGLAANLLRYTLMTLFLQAVCIIGGSIWGIVGIAAGYLVAAGLEWPLSLWWLSRITPLPVQALLSGAGRILACAVPAGVASFAATRALADEPSVLALIAALAAGIAVYGLAMLASKPVRLDLRGVATFGRRMVRG
jgi:PST family polysaccharide transporter